MQSPIQQTQSRHSEWDYQWSHHVDRAEFLFFDWIAPRTLEDFRDKRVLDAGCGPGHHISLIAPVERWFNSGEFDNLSITAYKGVSWHASGVVK